MTAIGPLGIDHLPAGSAGRFKDQDFWEPMVTREPFKINYVFDSERTAFPPGKEIPGV